MQFGFCYLPDYHQRDHGSYSDWYRNLLREWQTADQLGYDTLWIAEHRLAGYGFCSTPVIAQAIAGRTERIRIGTAVSLIAQRHPVMTAEDWAAVDVLSNGRLNFGIGRGIFAYDFAVSGVDSGESRERFTEAWEVIRRLWTEENVSHHGKFWSFENHTLGPQPLQKPTPPVFVACIATPESYQRAGESGCHLMVAPFLLKSTEQQCEYLDLYRESLAKAGHDPSQFQVLGNYHLAIAESEQVITDMDSYIYRYLDFIEGLNAKQNNALDKQQYAAYRSGETLWHSACELRNTRAVVGTPQQCIDRIGELAERCDLTGWMFHVNYGGVPHERVIEQMHMFADRVMPEFFGSHDPKTLGIDPGASSTDISRGKLSSSSSSLNNGSTNPTNRSTEKQLAQSARRITALAFSFTCSCVLFAANKLDLFSRFGNNALNAAEVSAEVGSDLRGMERLLDGCSSLGLLIKEDSRYRLSEDCRTMLDRNSPHYLGDWVAHWADMMVKGCWQMLAENACAGEPLAIEKGWLNFDDSRDALDNWVVGMHEMGVAGHADIIASVDSLKGATSFLDVGGGPGTYSIYMCRRHPQLSATIVDSAEVSAVAAKLVAKAGLSHRVHFVDGDFRSEKLHQKYDAILLSNVLHMCDIFGAMDMLRNAYEHLNPSGTLLVQEWMLSDDCTEPQLSAMFNLNMLINPNGDLYRSSQLRSMITRAGFTFQDTIETGGVYDVMVATKVPELVFAPSSKQET